MAIIGHCLIWHSQLAPWFCVDKDGIMFLRSPEEMDERPYHYHREIAATVSKAGM